ncbi:MULTISPECIES: fimbrial biogenesis chaperone [Gibbsiella]|uniref:Molecular chaperone n=1 Tax=Gibbsiella dentisursi TaxID=796890 RepID=A0ABP7KKU4_9GAMM|nr:molecular chaperone [Gibbsiella quercinecans]
MISKITLLCSLLLTSTFYAHASVVVNNTRVIFDGGKKSTNVQLMNKSSEAHLVQSWIDDGNPDARPEDLKLALAVVPAVVRIDADNGQVLNIVKNDLAASLPTDRESVFWLNIIDVPPVPQNKSGNYLQFAVRSRLKVFYRPAGLAISPNSINQHIRVQGSCIKNETPYFVTVIGIEDKKSKGGNLLDKALLLRPFSCNEYDKRHLLSDRKSYTFKIIDDFGTQRDIDISN